MIFMADEKKKPKFHRPNYTSLVRVGTKWRKPKGRQSKLRIGEKSKGSKPKIGYGSKSETRGFVKGVEPVKINNVEELQNINKEKQGAMIAKVGMKKYKQIFDECKKNKIKILNKVRKVKK